MDWYYIQDIPRTPEGESAVQETYLGTVKYIPLTSGSDNYNSLSLITKTDQFTIRRGAYSEHGFQYVALTSGDSEETYTCLYIYSNSASYKQGNVSICMVMGDTPLFHALVSLGATLVKCPTIKGKRVITSAPLSMTAPAHYYLGDRYFTYYYSRIWLPLFDVVINGTHYDYLGLRKAQTYGYSSTKKGGVSEEFTFDSLYASNPDATSVSAFTLKVGDIVDFGNEPVPILQGWYDFFARFTTITYNGLEITSLEAGRTATLPCAGKKAITDIEVTAGYPLLITYNGEKTVVLRGETATLACASKKMVSDVSITDVTHALYNGVRLPIIPEDVLKEYPYAWIRKDEKNGMYDLALGTGTFYYNPSNAGIYQAEDPHQWYQLSIATAETATKWEIKEQTSGKWAIDTQRFVVWSNHDIPNGSATATEIYFEGSEPVLTDGLINPVRQQYFTLQQGQINQTVKNNYINANNASRVSHVGTEVKLTPFAKYELIGVNGVRYGVQIITTAGLAQIQAGVDLTTSNKLDLGWRTSGYTFTAELSAAVCWLTASYSDNSNITPNDAMPVYIHRIA